MERSHRPQLVDEVLMQRQDVHSTLRLPAADGDSGCWPLEHHVLPAEPLEIPAPQTRQERQQVPERPERGPGNLCGLCTSHGQEAARLLPREHAARPSSVDDLIALRQDPERIGSEPSMLHAPGEEGGGTLQLEIDRPSAGSPLRQ